MADVERLLEPIVAMHDLIRDAVVDACTRQSAEQLSMADDADTGDTIYGVDRVSEAVLVNALGDLAREEPLCLVAEGLRGGAMTLPAGTPDGDCRWRIIVDPIDGTRGLMYQKRSAWVLTGVAPNHGPHTRLRDIELAVQTEIPLVKQHLCDQLWAVRGRGASARRIDRVTGASEPLVLRPSRADTIAHGFATVVRFFPGVRDLLAAVDDEVVLALLGPPAAGKAACFEDQYASTGGQLYELMAGHDRFIADLRPLTQAAHRARGLPSALCCHPYDICTALIADELGVPIAAPGGAPLDIPFDIDADVAWVGYANAALRSRVEPVLRDVLSRHGLLSDHETAPTL
jgi:fructose-1,6-bisphosphatase/inositol monophosphatase family enzyme